MSVFVYEIRDDTGVLKKNIIEAPTIEIARRKLQEQRFTVISIREQQATFTDNVQQWWSSLHKVDEMALAVFARQFSTMINAGMTILHSLECLAEQTEDRKLWQTLVAVRRHVEAGAPLSTGMAQFPAVFSTLFVNMIKAGEMGGVLDEVLDRLATFMEKDITLRKKVKGALTYPMMILAMAVIIVGLLVTFVLPTFVEMFDGMNVELPLPTQVLLAITKGARNPAILLPFFGGLGGLWVLFQKYNATPSGKRNIDLIKLNVPIFGAINKKVAISRLCRTLGTLIASGVPIMQALEIVGKASGNEIIATVIERTRDSIREGGSIVEPLKASALFPPMTVQMIGVGEETGNLDGMLNKISDFYDVEVEHLLGSLTAALEPLMIMGMGGVVGFIVIAIFMPLFSLINKMGG